MGIGHQQYRSLPELTFSADVAPVTPAQEAYLWLVESRGVYPENLPYAFHVRGRLDVTVLRDAIVVLMGRHEALRAKFGRTRADFGQAFTRTEPEFQVLEIGNRPVEDVVSTIVMDLFERPFDLASDVMVRVLAARVASDEWILAFVLSHIIVDGFSFAVLMRELEELYSAGLSGRQPALPEPPVFSEIAARDRSVAPGNAGYWHKYLDGAPFSQVVGIRAEDRVIELATNTSPANTFAFHTFELSSEEHTTVSRVAAAGHSTLFSTFLALYATSMHAAFQVEETVAITPLHGRALRSDRDAVGMLYRPVFLRCRPGLASTMPDLSGRVFADVLKASQHQSYPVAEYADYMYDSSWYLYFPTETALNLQDCSIARLEVPDSPNQFMRFRDDDYELFAPIDLHVEVEGKNMSSVTFGYKELVVTESDIRDLEHVFRTVIARLAARVDVSMAALSGRGVSV